MKTQTIKHSQSSFTLIELLVVIAIIGILAGMIFVNVSGVIERAKIARSLQFSDSLRNALIMNLVSEWKFDENSGTIAKDFWGGNNGTLVNGPTWKTGGDCVSGSCLQFDGSNDYVDCGNGASLSIVGAMTLEAWIYPLEKSESYRTIISKGYNYTENYQLRMEDTARGNHFSFEIGNGSKICSSPFISIKNNQWYHVVGYFDRNKVGIFINGEDKGSTSYATTPNLNTVNVTIGKNTSGSGEYWKGLIDEVRIYNAALPTAQIQQHYAEGLKSLLANNAITEQEYAQRISDFNQVLVKN